MRKTVTNNVTKTFIEWWYLWQLSWAITAQGLIGLFTFGLISPPLGYWTARALSQRRAELLHNRNKT